jgi:acyl-CoA thioesterase I
VSILLVVLACVANAAQQPALLVFGDSLSAGYGLPQDTGWVSLLQQRLTQSKRSYRVINASISGETSAGGRARFLTALTQYRPRLLILQLGGNDGLRGLPVNAFRVNMDAMIKEAKAANVKVLLVGIRLPTNYGKSYREKFQLAYADLAKSNRVARVDSLLESMEARRELFQADGIHAAKDAQPILLENVWRKLVALLDD